MLYAKSYNPLPHLAYTVMHETPPMGFRPNVHAASPRHNPWLATPSQAHPAPLPAPLARPHAPAERFRQTDVLKPISPLRSAPLFACLGDAEGCGGCTTGSTPPRPRPSSRPVPRRPSRGRSGLERGVSTDLRRRGGRERHCDADPGSPTSPSASGARPGPRATPRPPAPRGFGAPANERCKPASPTAHSRSRPCSWTSSPAARTAVSAPW